LIIATSKTAVTVGVVYEHVVASLVSLEGVNQSCGVTELVIGVTLAEVDLAVGGICNAAIVRVCPAVIIVKHK
jgi:hypothetical protein